jgi:hypothetical protein
MLNAHSRRARNLKCRKAFAIDIWYTYLAESNSNEAGSLGGIHSEAKLET